MPLFSELGYQFTPSNSYYYTPSASYLSRGSSSPYSHGYSGHSLLSSNPRSIVHYGPKLPSISETSSSAYRRNVVNPLLRNVAYYKRPTRIDTENIDLSRPKTSERGAESVQGEITRGKSVVRIHTKKLKENPVLDLAQKKKKTPGELLVEKFLIKEKKKEEPCDKEMEGVARSGFIGRYGTVKIKGAAEVGLEPLFQGRRVSITDDVLIEEAAFLDSMIEEEMSGGKKKRKKSKDLTAEHKSKTNKKYHKNKSPRLVVEDSGSGSESGISTGIPEEPENDCDKAFESEEASRITIKQKNKTNGAIKFVVEDVHIEEKPKVGRKFNVFIEEILDDGMETNNDNKVIMEVTTDEGRKDGCQNLDESWRDVGHEVKRDTKPVKFEVEKNMTALANELDVKERDCKQFYDLNSEKKNSTVLNDKLSTKIRKDIKDLKHGKHEDLKENESKKTAINIEKPSKSEISSSKDKIKAIESPISKITSDMKKVVTKPKHKDFKTHTKTEVELKLNQPEKNVTLKGDLRHEKLPVKTAGFDVASDGSLPNLNAAVYKSNVDYLASESKRVPGTSITTQDNSKKAGKICTGFPFRINQDSNNSTVQNNGINEGGKSVTQQVNKSYEETSIKCKNEYGNKLGQMMINVVGSKEISKITNLSPCSSDKIPIVDIKKTADELKHSIDDNDDAIIKDVANHSLLPEQVPCSVLKVKKQLSQSKIKSTLVNKKINLPFTNLQSERKLPNDLIATEIPKTIDKFKSECATNVKITLEENKGNEGDNSLEINCLLNKNEINLCREANGLAATTPDLASTATVTLITEPPATAVKRVPNKSEAKLKHKEEILKGLQKSTVKSVVVGVSNESIQSLPSSPLEITPATPTKTTSLKKKRVFTYDKSDIKALQSDQSQLKNTLQENNNNTNQNDIDRNNSSMNTLKGNVPKSPKLYKKNTKECCEQAGFLKEQSSSRKSIKSKSASSVKQKLLDLNTTDHSEQCRLVTKCIEDESDQIKTTNGNLSTEKTPANEIPQTSADVVDLQSEVEKLNSSNLSPVGSLANDRSSKSEYHPNLELANSKDSIGNKTSDQNNYAAGKSDVSSISSLVNSQELTKEGSEATIEGTVPLTKETSLAPLEMKLGSDQEVLPVMIVTPNGKESSSSEETDSESSSSEDESEGSSKKPAVSYCWQLWHLMTRDNTSFSEDAGFDCESTALSQAYVDAFNKGNIAAVVNLTTLPIANIRTKPI